MSHALLAPSSAARWSRCPGSVALSHGAADDGNEYSDEGTAAHWIGSECLSSGADASYYVGAVLSVLVDGSVQRTDETPAEGEVRNSFVVDEEMAAYVQVYLDACRRARDQLNAVASLVEHRVDFSESVGVPGQKGTLDYGLVGDGVLEVHDLKFGRSPRGIVYASWTDEDDVVHPNEQLGTYALGLMREFDTLCSFDLIRLVIHQPRLDHHDVAEFTAAEMAVFAQTLRAAAAEAMSCFAHPVIRSGETATISHTIVSGEIVELLRARDADVLHVEGMLRPGEKQCRWCKAAATCPALRTAVDDTIEGHHIDDTGSVLPAPGELELVETWLKAARSYIESELLRGREDPNWKLVQGRKGPRQWAADAVAEVTELLKKSFRLRDDEMYDMKLLGPAKLEKVLKPKQWAKLEPHITQSDGGLSVAPADDKRPAANPNVARSDEFDDLT